MRTRLQWVVLGVIVALSSWWAVGLLGAGSDAVTPGGEKLAVVWTSGDPDVAHKVCLMYTHAAKRAGWFDEVELVVWGPSSRLLAGDKTLQAKIKAMRADGVTVRACVACADMYGVADALRSMGIDVKPMGQPLTQMLKEDCKILTF